MLVTIMRSRMQAYPPSEPLFALVTQREERERVAWRDQTMVLKETTVSVVPMQFIFAYNYLDNKENKPQKTCAWVCFEWIERAFFRSPLNDVFVGIFWNVIILFLYKNANFKYLVAHPNPQNACMRCMPMFTYCMAKRRRISFYCVSLCNAWCD